MPCLPIPRTVALAIAFTTLLSHVAAATNLPQLSDDSPQPAVTGWQVAEGFFNQFTAPAGEAPGQTATAQDTAEPVALTGLWSGTYVCNQGNTELDLVLQDLSKGLVWGIFSFHAPPENPDVPSGQFFMAGRYDPHSGQIDLVPGEWIVRPVGYATVGLTGQIMQPGTGANGSAISGAVIFDGCTTFEVSHVTGTAVTLGSVPPAVQALLNSLK